MGCRKGGSALNVCSLDSLEPIVRYQQQAKEKLMDALVGMLFLIVTVFLVVDRFFRWFNDER
jgi:hypothetical protein